MCRVTSMLDHFFAEMYHRIFQPFDTPLSHYIMFNALGNYSNYKGSEIKILTGIHQRNLNSRRSYSFSFHSFHRQELHINYNDFDPTSPSDDLHESDKSHRRRTERAKK